MRAVVVQRDETPELAKAVMDTDMEERTPMLARYLMWIGDMARIKACVMSMGKSRSAWSRHIIRAVGWSRSYRSRTLLILYSARACAGNVGGGKVKTTVEVMRIIPVDQLADDLTVPGLVELVDHDTAEERDVAHNADEHLEKLVEVLVSCQLIVDLTENANMSSIPPAPSPRPVLGSTAVSTAALCCLISALRRMRERALSGLCTACVDSRSSSGEGVYASPSRPPPSRSWVA